MADSIQALAREEMINAIAASLPSTMAFFNAQKARRINWRVLVEMFQKGSADGLTAPWSVFWAGAATASDEWGITNDAFVQSFTVWWVEEFRDSNGTVRSTFEVRKAIEDALNDIRKMLRSTAFVNFTVLEAGQINTSEDTEANKFFIGSNLPFEAGELTFQVVWGER